MFVFLYRIKLSACSEADYPAVASSMAEWAADKGVSGLYTPDFARRGQVVSALVKQHIFYR